jgi:hypothetical protein
MKLRWTAIGPAFVAIYFLVLTGRAVYTYFSPDDLLGIYQAWTKPAAEIVKANLLFFLPSELARPLASAWWRVLYNTAGMHPAPFKIVNLAMLVANIFLTYSVARRLAKSRTAGTLAALIVCYHPEALDLDFNTGFVSDVLCYLFYFSAANLYVRARDEDRFPSWRELAAICGLYICALNAKELAVTLPVFLLLYEVVVSRWKDAGWKGLLSWHRAAGILATGTLTLVWLIGKMSAPVSLMHANAMYRPMFTWHQFMVTSVYFTAHLFLRPNSWTATMVIALWSVMLAVAWLLRSRALWFAWLFIMLSPLPLAFIPERGVAQYYIPLFGWALYAAALLDLGLDRVFPFSRDLSISGPREFRKPAFRNRAFINRTVAGAALVVLIAAVLYPPWRKYQTWNPYPVLVEAEMNRAVVKQLHRLEPRLPPGARLMFLDDPIQANRWNMTFMVHLSYGDAHIQVDRMKSLEVGTDTTSNPGAKNPDLASYDHVFDYRGGQFIELARPWRRAATPLIVMMEDGRPQIFHGDGKLLTRDDPVRPGEDVSAKVMDLGATVPAVPAGEPFSGDQRAEVVANVEARVDGAPAEILLKIGWPTTTLYRVEIRIPATTPKGLSWLQLTAGGVTGPAVEFPVR